MRNPIIQTKKLEYDTLMKNMQFPNHKILGIISLTDTHIRKEFIEGLKTMPINCIVIGEGKSEGNIFYQAKVNDTTLLASDFIVGDADISDIEKYMKAGVVPIVNKKNYLSSLLSEFNPIKNEGNAFIYSEDSAWQIFYALCRYLENSKFSFDNQNLIANVVKI